jgi:hypothetical protein
VEPVDFLGILTRNAALANMRKITLNGEIGSKRIGNPGMEELLEEIVEEVEGVEEDLLRLRILVAVAENLLGVDVVQLSAGGIMHYRMLMA